MISSPSSTSRISAAERSVLTERRCSRERVTYRLADVVIATNESYRKAAIERGHKDPRTGCSSSAALPTSRGLPAARLIRASRRGKEHLLCYRRGHGTRRTGSTTRSARWRRCAGSGRTDWHAVFVGSGELLRRDDRPLTAARARRRGSTFTGRIPDEAPASATSRPLDVALSPDPRNPLNDVSTMNKVLEYMAVGCPIVSFDLARGPGLGRRSGGLRGGQRHRCLRERRLDGCSTTPPGGPGRGRRARTNRGDAVVGARRARPARRVRARRRRGRLTPRALRARRPPRGASG